MNINALTAAIILTASSALGSGLSSTTVNRLADAIYRVEGGARAKAPYGILSIKVVLKKDRRDWDQEEYLGSLCGEWHSYVDMIKTMTKRYGLSTDVAKGYWTGLKNHLSVKEPSQSGLTYKTYTYIPNE